MTALATAAESARDKTVIKAVTLLRALRVAPNGGSARELATMTGLARSTVQRLLTTLAETQILTQDPQDQRYRIGPQALWIGMGYGGGQSLVALARPVLHRLRDATEETAGLSVAMNTSRVFVEEVQSRSGLRYASELGKLYPLWSGSMGRVLMSRLSPERVEEILADRELVGEVDHPISAEQTRYLIAKARTDGFGTAFGETLVGTSSISVGVTDAPGDVVAAISLGGPESRLTSERMLEALPMLQDAAADLSKQLGTRYLGNDVVEAKEVTSGADRWSSTSP